MKRVAVLLDAAGWPTKTIDFTGENPEPSWKEMSLDEYGEYCRSLQGMPKLTKPDIEMIADKYEPDTFESNITEEPKRKRGRPRRVAVDHSSSESGGES